VVVAAFIDEAPAGEKPIYLKATGVPAGAYRRIGASDVRCSDDDIHLFHTLAQEGRYEDSLPRWEMGDLDDDVIEDYRKILLEQGKRQGLLDKDRGSEAERQGFPNPKDRGCPGACEESRRPGQAPEVEDLRRIVRELCSQRPMTTARNWLDSRQERRRPVRTLAYHPDARGGRPERIYPENPAHPRQAYRTTGAGKEKTMKTEKDFETTIERNLGDIRAVRMGGRPQPCIFPRNFFNSRRESQT